MAIYWHFYVEQLGDHGWGKPMALIPDIDMFNPELGQFAWVHPREGWLELFFSEEALFPFHMGPPPDWGSSPLLNHLQDVHSYDFDSNEDSVAWISLPELFLDEWQNETVLVAYRVESRWIPFFRDGNSSFPVELLNHAEFDVGVSFRERARRWHGDPICGQAPAETGFNVTCRETILEYVGEHYASLFTGICEYGRAENLRILSVRG